MTDQNFTTDDAGIPVSSDEHSLTIGTDGPILLQDHYLIEKMAQFNRERVAERQPHAKGAGRSDGSKLPKMSPPTRKPIYSNPARRRTC